MTIRYVLSVSITAAAVLTAATCASASGKSQTIYLDPDTGDVIQHPAPQAPGARSSQQSGTPPSRQESNNGYTRWTTEDGTKMLAVDPSKAPHENVVHCADRSLRMGSRVGRSDQRAGDRDLCGQSIR